MEEQGNGKDAIVAQKHARLGADADIEVTSHMTSLVDAIHQSQIEANQSPSTVVGVAGTSATSSDVRRMRCVLYIVGGGTLAFNWLFGRPGASSWLLEARIPYGTQSLKELFKGNLSGTPCSQETAIGMARLACTRAQALSEVSLVASNKGSPYYLGVGFTGALSSKEPKKGGSRCFLALARENGSTTLHTLRLDALGRSTEETITSELIVKAIALALGMTNSLGSLDLPIGTVTSTISPEIISPKEAITKLRDSQEITHLLFPPANGRDGASNLVNGAFKGLVCPGSFNPLHHGHTGLAEIARAKFPDLDFAFELSMVNVDKPTLCPNDVQKRLEQFANYPIVITKSPRFYEKAAIFPGSIFVIGADTAIRLVDSKYYENEWEKIAILSKVIHLHGCKFFVGGRLDSKLGVFTTCETEVQNALPRSLFEAGFMFATEKEFRMDISSTELRNSGFKL